MTLKAAYCYVKAETPRYVVPYYVMFHYIMLCYITMLQYVIL